MIIPQHSRWWAFSHTLSPSSGCQVFTRGRRSINRSVLWTVLQPLEKRNDDVAVLPVDNVQSSASTFLLALDGTENPDSRCKVTSWVQWEALVVQMT